MSGRVLNNLAGFQNRTLTGISSDDNINDIKNKYDFDSSIQSGSLLIGSSSGKYTNNTLTAGANVTITNSTGQNGKGTITIASSKLGVTAGTNLSKETNLNGDITLNLDAVIGSMSSINGFTLVTNIASAANQFLLKDNSVGAFPAYSFLTTNANGLIVPNTQAVINTVIQNTILGGTNITKTSAGGNITLNLDSTLTSITKINNYNANVLTVNNTDSQYLIKDNNVNLSANSILSVGSNGKISSTTPTIILNNITAGTNLNKATDSNTINLDATLTSITSVNGYVFNTATSSTVNQFLLKDTTVGSFASGDLLTINSSNKVDNITPTQLLNNLTVSNGLTKSTNNISISTTPSINLGDTMTLSNISGNGGHAILKIQAGTSTSFSPKIQLFQDNTVRTYLQYDKVNNKFFILAPTGEVHLLAYNGTASVEVNNQNVEIKTDNNIKVKVESNQVSINTTMSMGGKIAMNSRTINFGSATDNNHQISYSASNGGGTGAMDGVIIRGYGGNVPFFRLQETATGSAGLTVADFYKDKIRFLKPLLMSGNLINFQTTNTNRENFIQFKEADGMNGILVKGFGINSSTDSVRRALFRVETSDPGVSQPILLNVFPERVDVFKKLSVIKDNSTLQGDTSDIFTVRNTGFTKAIIHSTNNDCELCFRTGSIQSTLRYFPAGHFTLATQSTINLQNGNCRVAMQTDNNLVVYTTSGVVKFASNDSQNAHSSRDYKKNINDLVESDSVNIIKNINPVSFEYIEKYWDKHDRCNACNCDIRKGFIWEDIKPILPQTARTINMDNPDEETTKTLDLKMVIPDLTKTVQYLLKEIDTLKKEINNLQNNI